MSADSDHAYETLIQFLYRAPVALMQLRLDGEIEMLNPMASRLLMPLAPDGDLQNLFEVLRPHAPDLAQLSADFAPEHGLICEGRRITLPAGADKGPEVLSLGLLKVDRQRLMAVLVDATHEVMREQRVLASRLASAARLDPLTQLANRSRSLELLQEMTQRARQPDGDHCAVLFINVDRFKQINDTFGNEVGDQVMVLVAERLRTTVRSGGRPPGKPNPTEVAARVGGDEFALLLDGLPQQDTAERIAARLLDRLSLPFQVGAHELICTFSIGIVPLEEGARQADDVLRDAAIAMRVAKAEGGNRFAVFARQMREQAVLRGGLEADLRNAIERGELFTVYQPVVGLLADGRIDRTAGVEALVRWRHPVRGLVGPTEFIGVAEDCGLIGAIGEQVLDMACADFARWRAQLGAGAPRLLAVNLSRAQLNQSGLCERVGAIMAAHGMEPGSLQLEITESLAAQGTDVRQQLLGLKALGVKLALDDFGTGYSSLSSLHLLPVDTVKIDRSFITLAASSRHHEVLIEATVKVARSLGMNTVAEGIETPQQAAVVSAQGCDKGQGYLYSRPISGAAIEEWLSAVA
ncbi:diguanylate cyclase (GGDEF)-like protein [Duganella sp. SG902]|uniref:putative bifunctional diguanylate cyclase/phosphodiesterase n=1 Tax=Duganella sp. SG902 TaxID=2587016 RepID=UPI00159E5505|nr:bifunctional diguanylate cyclase/phosphodiesterase [Duganella sp. SG902]NVM78490.1 diguanylate cyclase (GGDEF)-like protein [Duganella sp. SG902]